MANWETKENLGGFRVSYSSMVSHRDGQTQVIVLRMFTHAHDYDIACSIPTDCMIVIMDS